MEKLTITEARNRFMKLPDETPGNQIIAVTRRNKEVMAVMSWELYEGLLETIEILADPELMKSIKTGIKEIKSGKTDRIETLKDEPIKQGKMLVQKLAGLRSIHVAGRYRVIYKIDEDSSAVWVLAAGIRKEGDQKDIYRIAKKLLKLGLLNYET
jgi:mRNA interferase RelE/StbE